MFHFPPSELWELTAEELDFWHSQAKRFVAGAMQDGLLADLRTAVDRAIAEGTTLADFRRDVDAIDRR